MCVYTYVSVYKIKLICNKIRLKLQEYKNTEKSMLYGYQKRKINARIKEYKRDRKLRKAIAVFSKLE